MLEDERWQLAKEKDGSPLLGADGRQYYVDLDNDCVAHEPICDPDLDAIIMKIDAAYPGQKTKRAVITVLQSSAPKHLVWPLTADPNQFCDKSFNVPPSEPTLYMDLPWNKRMDTIPGGIRAFSWIWPITIVHEVYLQNKDGQGFQWLTLLCGSGLTLGLMEQLMRTERIPTIGIISSPWTRSRV